MRKATLPLLLAASAAAAAGLGGQMVTSVPPEEASDLIARSPAALPPIPAADPLRGTIATWYRLQQTDSAPFPDYAAFLVAHPGWPGEAAMRRAAERQIDPVGTPPAQIIAFFAGKPPQTGAGRGRLAEALAIEGRTAEARTAAVAAWAGGALAAADESRLLAAFPGAFSPLDQDRRMERLLWDGATTAAARQLPLVSSARRPLYAARLAFQTRSADAASAETAAGPGADRDPGFVADRAAWLRDTAQGVASRQYLARPRQLDGAPLDPAKYLNVLLTAATGAAKDGQADTALAIARNADGAWPQGTDLRARSFPERDAYTSLVWLGGTQALKPLARPRDAVPLFLAYSRASQSPSSQAKGLYWAGRAAQAAGDTANANGYYALAANHVDQFYGQLAAERIARPLSLPPETNVPIAPAARAAFYNSEIVRAARLLGQDGRWQDQTAFIRTIAAAAKTDADHALAGELATAIARPDLGVIVSRSARASGTPDPARIGFPTMVVPPTMQSHWTIVHAITRQESQFDRQATSRVGAKGMMQLMPATAREQAGKLGLPFEQERLIEPSYNVMLGSVYFDWLMNRFANNYVLSVAAYNAGPGNVNKFLRANGDPRTPGVDVIDWIEAIPLTETRGYVQRVLENAVMYDLMNPQRARAPTANRLSWYLGKTTAG
ncbi:MAG: lytic transglycosylase domain-containing protein [Sphingomonas fennica]